MSVLTFSDNTFEIIPNEFQEEYNFDYIFRKLDKIQEINIKNKNKRIMRSV